MNTTPVSILLVEDDEIDAEGIRRAFARMRIANPLTVARDGVEGLQILRGEDGQPRFPTPHIILLDLNMPRMTGLEFLDAIRKDPKLHSSVVFVLSTSAEESDKVQAYDYNVAGYIHKTRAGETFMEAVAMLDHYWRLVEFPNA